MNLDDIHDALNAAGLDRITDEVSQGALPAIHITDEPVDEGELPVGASKFGGHPDLPSDVEWPMNGATPLTFLAQFDLAEVAPFDGEKLLPPAGLLSFFYDSQSQPWGNYPTDRGGWCVLYSNPTARTLRRFVDWPAALPVPCRLDASRLSFSKRLTLPGLDHIVSACDLSHDEGDRYERLAYALAHNSHVLGHPDDAPGHSRMLCEVYSTARPEDMESVDDAIYEGRFPSDWPDAATKAKAISWRLLLQLSNFTELPEADGDEDENDPARALERISDAWARRGQMCFWIQKGRLARRDFSNVWLLCMSEY